MINLSFPPSKEKKGVKMEEHSGKSHKLNTPLSHRHNQAAAVDCQSTEGSIRVFRLCFLHLKASITRTQTSATSNGISRYPANLSHPSYSFIDIIETETKITARIATTQSNIRSHKRMMLDFNDVGARVSFNVSGTFFLSLRIRPRRIEWCKSVNIKAMGAINTESLPMLTRETAATATERRIEAHRNCWIWLARAENGLFSFTAIKKGLKKGERMICSLRSLWLSGNLPA